MLRASALSPPGLLMCTATPVSVTVRTNKAAGRACRPSAAATDTRRSDITSPCGASSPMKQRVADRHRPNRWIHNGLGVERDDGTDCREVVLGRGGRVPAYDGIANLDRRALGRQHREALPA